MDGDIKRVVPLRSRTSYLASFANNNPRSFFRALPPSTNEYSRLMKEKMRLEKLLRQGRLGAEGARQIAPARGQWRRVVALRNRLISMGYMRRSSSQTYDAPLQKAVQLFQQDQGLNPDVSWARARWSRSTVRSPRRLQSVIVAMERERWMNKERGARHVLVNLTDFSARDRR